MSPGDLAIAARRAAGARAPGLRGAGELVRIARFCVVGASNTVVTLAAFGLVLSFGCPSPLASAVGFVLGAVNGYVWNTRWTFAGHGAGGAVLTRYVVVQVGCAALSAAGIVLARGDGLARLPAEVVILPLVTLVAYVLARLVVFRRPRTSARH